VMDAAIDPQKTRKKHLQPIGALAIMRGTE